MRTSTRSHVGARPLVPLLVGWAFGSSFGVPGARPLWHGGARRRGGVRDRRGGGRSGWPVVGPSREPPGAAGRTSPLAVMGGGLGARPRARRSWRRRARRPWHQRGDGDESAIYARADAGRGRSQWLRLGGARRGGAAARFRGARGGCRSPRRSLSRLIRAARRRGAEGGRGVRIQSPESDGT